MTGPDEELTALRAAGQWRALVPRPPGEKLVRQARELLDFSSNDYLGLTQHEALIEAAVKATRDYGAGSGSSRLVTGSLQITHELEAALADFHEKEAALVFANGWAAATGAIPALVGKGDTVILDKLAHACLIDGARLSQATLRVFPHNNLEKLEKLLRGATGRVLVITEAVFSMDGDIAPLREICALKEQFGALLLVDEAHSVGVLGPQGRGLASGLGVKSQVDFTFGTLGKAAGAAGGYLAASRSWINLLVNKARSLIFSTAPPAGQAAAALAGLELLQGAHGDQQRLILAKNRELLGSPPAAIRPVILGSNKAALRASEKLMRAGFFAPAIRFPTVPKGAERLRVTLTSNQKKADVQRLRDVLSNLTPDLFDQKL